MAGMQVGEAVGTRRLEPRRIGLRARLPLRAGKPAAKGQRTCDIAPPLSKTCVFDLTRGRIIGEDRCRQTILIVPGPPGHGGRPLGGLSCFWALVFLLRAPPATPRTAFPSDPETGSLVNPTCAGKLKLSAPILRAEAGD